MICHCGGILIVKKIEDVPNTLSKEKQLLYNRLCDVKCIKCGKVIYSQPYDAGNKFNGVKKLER